jgi:hypothetical protein
MRIGQGGHWTLDYASNNGTFLHELVILLEARDIDFDAIDCQIMCFAHVINTCCQHVIASLTNVALTESAEVSVGMLPPSLPDQQTFEDTVKWDPVALGHNIVHVLRSSGQRHDLFEDVICDGNAKGWFLDDNVPPKPYEFPLVQLLCDMVVRWDTLYYMVRRLRELRPVRSINLLFQFYLT